MANEIAERIAQNQAKPKLPGLSRREKAANREAVKELAAKHMEAAIKKLGDIISDKHAPASAKVAAATQLLDRVAGKPKLVDEKQTEQSALEKMSAPELMEYITQQFSGMPLSARAIMVESLDKGLAFDAADIMDAIEEPAPAQSREPKPKREPRR